MIINNGKDPSVFLDEVHSRIIQKYTIDNGVLGSAKIMEAKAQKIQTFLQNLKTDAKNGDEVANTLHKTILSDIQVMSNAGTKMSKLFQRSGGAQFEKELSKVVISVMARSTQQALDEINMENINIGSKSANVNLQDPLALTGIVQSILESVGTKAQRIMQDSSGKKHKYFTLTSTAGKVDVQGYQVQSNVQIAPEWRELYDLLSEASFSVKNYGNYYWDFQNKILAQSTQLKLGNTNIFKTYYGVLSDLGYGKSQIVSSFKRILKHREDPKICQRINQIRFVYELTGVGLSYDNGNSLLKNQANYFVYNNPDTGEIYVKSTAKMIADILENMDMISAENPFTKQNMYISKEYFHNY